MNSSEQNVWKRTAAEAAADMIEDGMVVGLGTGTTAAMFVTALSRRVSRERLHIVGIPTSEETARRATQLGIELTSFAEHAQIDMTVDGADEVQLETLFLIKGHGGALLREKIVASSSKWMVVIADETKLVEKLGSLCTVPVEVVPFGWQATESKLREIGAKTQLRTRDGAVFQTDSGNYIVDCDFGAMENPKETAHHLDHIVGSVEHGLFLRYASQVIVGGREGVKTLMRKNS
jgi:ribose 5-phosphate isomerase A